MRIALRVLSYVVAACAISFFSRALWLNWQAIRAYDWRVDWRAAAASTSVVVLVFGLVVVNFRLLLKRLRLEVSYWPLFRAFHLSNLGHYLPGKVWSVVGFVALAERAGVGKGRSGQAILLGTAASTAAGLVVGLTAAAIWPPVDLGDARWLLLGFVVAIVGGLHPAVSARALRFIVRVMRRNVEITPVPFSSMLVVVAAFVGSWSAWSIGFALLVKSLSGVAWLEAARALSVFPLAYLLGLFAVFAPGGLGVREGSISVLCAGFLPLPVALTISVLSRFQIGMIELVAALVSAFIRSRGEAREC